MTSESRAIRALMDSDPAAAAYVHSNPEASLSDVRQHLAWRIIPLTDPGDWDSYVGNRD